MKHLQMTQALYNYMTEISLRESPVLTELREKTAELPVGGMQVAPEQGQFLQFLVRILRAEKILELGTFTGYSALAMALALPENGRLITCDRSENWTKNARKYWEEAQVSQKIELVLAPALQTLEQLLADGHAASFDFIFIDADKTNYRAYYEYALQLIKPEGLIAIDNIFWEGDVINPLNHDAQTREIRALNEFIKTDDRVHLSLLPIGDGLFLIQKNTTTM
jgi:predicted O-methyltransferase YrrM